MIAVFGNARRLFKNLPPLLRLGGNDVLDPALSDDGIAVSAETGVHEQHLNVLEAHRCVVDEVFARPRPIAAAGDLHIVRVKIQRAIGVADDERHLGKAHRLAQGGAVENDILRFVAAQRLVGLLTEHPTDGVADVGFAAAVRADDGGDAVAEIQNGLIGKGFEAVQLQCFQNHSASSPFQR